MILMIGTNRKARCVFHEVRRLCGADYFKEEWKDE